jgi:hypothetical protein
VEDVFKAGLGMTIVVALATFVAFMLPRVIRAYRMAVQETVPSVDRDEMEALRSEMDDLRALPSRVAELEERLDFAERMLAHRESERLPRGRDE